MKAFIVLGIFFVLLQLCAAVSAELGLNEYNLLDPSKTEEDFDESTRNLALAVNEKLQESDVTEEERIGRCVCRRSPCPCDRRHPRSEEEQRRKKCRHGFTWPHCN